MHEQQEDYKQRCRVIWDKQALELKETSMTFKKDLISSSSSVGMKGSGKKGKQLGLNLKGKNEQNDDKEDSDEDSSSDDDDDELESAVSIMFRMMLYSLFFSSIF